MAAFSPPPTYADVVLIDQTKQPGEPNYSRFNPIWLKWFVDLAALLPGNSALGTVTSVNGSGGTTGLTLTGGPITAAGTLTLGGTLAIANGGTGVASLAFTSFTTTRTGWTDVGAPTVTARSLTIGSVCFFEIKVVPATTVATVAGTSYCSLPTTAAGLSGDASMGNLTTLIAIGNCFIDVANSRVYVPSQVATGNTLTIAGWYEV